jgi:hypothetical protein
VTKRTGHTPHGDELTAAILRHLRRAPNQYMAFDTLAAELGVEPQAVQIAVERLHRRRLLIAPCVEPGQAGGAQLTQVGLAWLIAHEGGTPRDVPVAFQPASGRVRAEDEAARLPRAQVYGFRTRTPSD